MYSENSPNEKHTEGQANQIYARSFYVQVIPERRPGRIRFPVVAST